MDIRNFFTPKGGAKAKADTSKESDEKPKEVKKTTPQKKEKKTPSKSSSRSRNKSGSKTSEKERKKSGDAKKETKKISEEVVVIDDDSKEGAETSKKSKPNAVKTESKAESNGTRDSKSKNKVESKESKDSKSNDKAEGKESKDSKSNNKAESKESKNSKSKDKSEDEISKDAKAALKADDKNANSKDKAKDKGSSKDSKKKKSSSSSKDEDVEMVSEEEESPIGKKKKKRKPSSDEEFTEIKMDKKGKKKSRVLVSDSEEEEEPVPKKSKRKKREAVIFMDESDEEDKKPRIQTLDHFVMNTPTPKKKEEKKKEAKATISADDFFGGGSVKRVERTPSTKRKSSQLETSMNNDDLELHDDDDFLQTLQQLDAQQPKRVKLDEDATKKSPSKNNEKSSLAKKLADKAKTASTSGETSDKDANDNNNNNSKTKKPSPAKLKNPSPKKTPAKVEITPTKTPVKTPPKKTETPKTGTKTQSPGEGDTPGIQRKGSVGYRGYLNREGPQALGSKEIPEGAENCLEGLTFVLTGVYESIERDEAKSLVEKYGGKVTTSISKKTNYIVVGRDAGESKLNKANQFGTKQLDEDGLFEVIKTRPGKKSKYTIQAEESVKKDKWLEKKASMSSQKEEPRTSSKPSSSSSKSLDFLSKPSSSVTDKSIGQSKSESQSEPTLLWVDKHKPTNMKTIIGQQGDKSNAKKLFNWLNSWHKSRASGAKPAGKFFNKANDDGSGFKAALLSGPPGVGKTTTATLVCKEAGFSYVELNASDTRSKKSLQTEVAESLNNTTLVDFMGTKTKSNHMEGQKHCLIMDEVDGMAGNADRGGLQELVSLIKGSKIPVLCICNDRNSMKMRTLSNYCFDLRFYKPRLEQIKGAMMSLAFKEGIKITPPAMNEIILAANQDIRQVIHNLSVWSACDKAVSYEQAKIDSKSAQKDMKIGPFDVCRKVFVSDGETAKMTIHDKSNLFFNDYSIAPLFVQENYPMVIPNSARGNMKQHLRLLAKTADSICDGDLTDKIIRKQGVWGLLPMQAMYSSVIPGELMRGGFPQMVAFPSWLGKNSSTGKTDRLLAELSMHMRLNISGDKRALAMDYLPVMRKALTEPLVQEGGEGVPKVIQLMDNYDITKDDFDNILDVSKWPNSSDPLSKLDSKTKAAFTRTYNKECHMTPYATGQTTKKKKGKGGAAGDDEAGLLKMEGEDDDAATVDSGEEDGDDLENDTMIKAKKAPAKGKTTKKEPAEKKTSGKGKGKGKGKS